MHVVTVDIARVEDPEDGAIVFASAETPHGPIVRELPADPDPLGGTPLLLLIVTFPLALLWQGLAIIRRLSTPRHKR